MTEKIATLSSWTHKGIVFSIVESVDNFCLASGAPDTRLLTFNGFRTYSLDRKNVLIEVTDAGKKEKAIEYAQIIYDPTNKPKRWNEQYIKSLEAIEAFEYQMHLYGPEYADDYYKSKDTYSGFRIVDIGQDLIDGHKSNGGDEVLDLPDEDWAM